MAFDSVGLDHEYPIDLSSRDADAGVGPAPEVALDLHRIAAHAPGAAAAVAGRFV